MMNNYLKLTAVAGAILLASGCATQIGTESQFGDAVRAVVSGQIYDMGAAQYPSADAVTGGNADRIETVLKVHAEDVSEGDKVAKPLVFGTTTSSRR